MVANARKCLRCGHQMDFSNRVEFNVAYHADKHGERDPRGAQIEVAPGWRCRECGEAERAQKRVSVRSHSNGRVITIVRDNEGVSEDSFWAQFDAPIPMVVGRHATQAEAQDEADTIMERAGHLCSAACSPWQPISN